MKILDEFTISSLMSNIGFVDQSPSGTQDKGLSILMSFIHFLDINKQEIISKEGTITLEDIIYSQYYWFNQYKREYYKKYGRDEGMEQQAFRLLENMNIELSNNLDWAVIEQIENGSIPL